MAERNNLVMQKMWSLVFIVCDDLGKDLGVVLNFIRELKKLFFEAEEQHSVGGRKKPIIAIFVNRRLPKQKLIALFSPGFAGAPR